MVVWVRVARPRVHTRVGYGISAADIARIAQSSHCVQFPTEEMLGATTEEVLEAMTEEVLGATVP